MYKLLVLDRNTWNHIIVYKLLVLDRNTWNHRIVYELFVLDRNTWNPIIVYKLLVLDRNTSNHTTMCKLFVFDRNTWCHVTATNNLGDQGLITGRVIPKTLKMVLNTYLLNTQHYKVHIKGKVEQSRKKNSTLPYTSV